MAALAGTTPGTPPSSLRRQSLARQAAGAHGGSDTPQRVLLEPWFTPPSCRVSFPFACQQHVVSEDTLNAGSSLMMQVPT